MKPTLSLDQILAAARADRARHAAHACSVAGCTRQAAQDRMACVPCLKGR